MKSKKEFDDDLELPITTVYMTWEIDGMTVNNKHCIWRFPEDKREQFIDMFKSECTKANEEFWHGRIKLVEIVLRSYETKEYNRIGVCFKVCCEETICRRIKSEIERNYKW